MSWMCDEQFPWLQDVCIPLHTMEQLAPALLEQEIAEEEWFLAFKNDHPKKEFMPHRFKKEYFSAAQHKSQVSWLPPRGLGI